MSNKHSAEPCAAVTLVLLDGGSGDPVQSWSFEGQPKITIGRASETDITLSNTQVSRQHVCLERSQGKWVLTNTGRNGTHIDGAAVEQATLSDGMVFQLGSNGPTFRFTSVNESSAAKFTIDDIPTDMLSFLTLDEQRHAEEIQGIVDNDEFRLLQDQAKKFRDRKKSSEE